MFKKMLIKIASDIVLEALLVLATKERDHYYKKWQAAEKVEASDLKLYDRYYQLDIVVRFLTEIKQKGLPL